jgi:hypothetical protein
MTATAPAQMPTEMSSDPNRTMYWIVGGVVVLLAVIGLITYGGNRVDAQAQDLANQLVDKFQAAGLPVPQDTDIITRSLGTDGGAVCDNPATSLGKAVLIDQIANGASFVGRRPVILDGRVLQGEALILETYCPDELPAYKQKIDDLKSDGTVKF